MLTQAFCADTSIQHGRSNFQETTVFIVSPSGMNLEDGRPETMRLRQRRMESEANGDKSNVGDICLVALETLAPSFRIRWRTREWLPVPVVQVDTILKAIEMCRDVRCSAELSLIQQILCHLELLEGTILVRLLCNFNEFRGSGGGSNGSVSRTSIGSQVGSAVCVCICVCICGSQMCSGIDYAYDILSWTQTILCLRYVVRLWEGSNTTRDVLSSLTMR